MDELTNGIIVVTGAAGYLGSRVVSRALASGLQVRAVVRPGRNLVGVPWSNDKKVKIVEIDMADELADFGHFIGGGESTLETAGAVIHIAGIIQGTKGAHHDINVAPMRRLVEAMHRLNCKKLVHVSSISVYGYASMPDHSQLDELTPLEPDLEDRDDYCQAKCLQESIIMESAQAGMVQATVLRPGVICGYEHAWTSRLGIKRAGVLLQVNRHGRIPITFVDHCAEAVVLAAHRQNFLSDVYLKPELVNTRCGFEAINIVEDNLPSQEEYLQILTEANISGYKIRLSIPWGFAKKLVNWISVLKVISPSVYRKIPLLGRKATFHARMKGLRYCNARLRDRLGWYPQKEAIDAIKNSWTEKRVEN